MLQFNDAAAFHSTFMKVRKNIKSTIYHIYYHYHIQIYIQKVLGEWMIISFTIKR